MRYCENGGCQKEAKFYKPGHQGSACCDEHKQKGRRDKLAKAERVVERIKAEIEEREGSYRHIIKGA